MLAGGERDGEQAGNSRALPDKKPPIFPATLLPQQVAGRYMCHCAVIPWFVYPWLFVVACLDHFSTLVLNHFVLMLWRRHSASAYSGSTGATSGSVLYSGSTGATSGSTLYSGCTGATISSVTSYAEMYLGVYVTHMGEVLPPQRRKIAEKVL